MKLGLVFLARVAPVVLVFTAGCAPSAPPAPARAAGSGGHTDSSRPVYRFDFTVSSSEGAGVATNPHGEAVRRFSMAIEQGDEGRLEAANNVPIGPGDRPPRLDVGMDVRCEYDRDGDALVLHTVLTMNSNGAGADGNDHPVHKIAMIGDALVAPGKPTVVATIADPSNQGRYELSVAATRLY